MLWPVVKALLGHYRRYPLQICLVWLGLTLGVSLLVGVTALTIMPDKVMSMVRSYFLILYPIVFAPSILLIKFRKAYIFSYVVTVFSSVFLSMITVLVPHQV